jgi:hypothetical protein
MTNAHRVAATRIVEAPPSRVFRIVCDPQMQVKIDGSGMLKASPNSRPLVSVGDTFEMEMDREPLGDLPMGKYKVLNTVTRIEPDALLEWNVGSKERGAFGHVYGWEMTAVGSGKTEVTNYCDWSDIPEKAHDRFPVVPKSMIEKSVDNLAELIAHDGGSSA